MQENNYYVKRYLPVDEPEQRFLYALRQSFEKGDENNMDFETFKENLAKDVKETLEGKCPHSTCH